MTSSYGSFPSKSLKGKALEKNRHMKTTTKFTCPTFAPLALACFAVLSTAQAVNPPPDGGYGNQNTAEGSDALFYLTSGVWNVAIGFQALYNDSSGNQNTATGYKALFNNTTGDKSTAYGSQALFSNTTGSDNVATGFSTLYSNSTGNRNTAVGYRTLTFNNGDDNTAVGWNALYNNTTGDQNTAIGSGALLHGSGSNNTATGFQALYNNTEGGYNAAVGANALFSNTTGGLNTANGYQALFSNTAGSVNTAVGWLALGGNTTGGGNTATGGNALTNNTTGTFNTATGINAMWNNTTGSRNTAIGNVALGNNTIGTRNTVVGSDALDAEMTGHRNTAIGDTALERLEAPGNSDNIALGYFAGGNMVNGVNDIVIGSLGADSDQNTIRIGNQVTATDFLGTVHPRHVATYIAGISGVGVTGMPVAVSANGQLGVALSSARFKEAIKPMDKASEAILSLKPVTFHYKKEIVADRTPQFGLVAEDVEKVNPDLVVKDRQGNFYSVRYDAVNAMLLNEFLKEHRKNEEQQKQINVLTAQLKEQAAQIQRVSAQLEATKPAPQVVNNP